MLNLGNRSSNTWNLLLSFGGCFGSVSGFFCCDVGCWLGVTTDITLHSSLTVYYLNYSEIKRNYHLFSKNPKWLPNTSYNIYPMMHCNCCCFLWGVHLPADEGVDLPNLKSSSPQEVCTGGGWSASRSRGRSAKFELIFTMRCHYQGMG